MYIYQPFKSSTQFMGYRHWQAAMAGDLHRHIDERFSKGLNRTIFGVENSSGTIGVKLFSREDAGQNGIVGVITMLTNGGFVTSTADIERHLKLLKDTYNHTALNHYFSEPKILAKTSPKYYGLQINKSGEFIFFFHSARFLTIQVLSTDVFHAICSTLHAFAVNNHHYMQSVYHQRPEDKYLLQCAGIKDRTFQNFEAAISAMELCATPENKNSIKIKLVETNQLLWSGKLLRFGTNKTQKPPNGK